MTSLSSKDSLRTLEEIVQENSLYDVPVEFIDDTLGMNMLNSHSDCEILKTSYFQYLKVIFRRLVEHQELNISPIKMPKYSLSSFNNKKIDGINIYGQNIIRESQIPLIHAETSDKFQVILDILKKQEDRIKELEDRFDT